MTLEPLIPFFLILIFFIKIKKGSKWTNPAVFIVSIYLFSALCSTIFINDKLAEDIMPNISISSIDTIYYFIFSILIIITLLPLKKIKNLSIDISNLFLNKEILIFAYILSFFAWFSFFYLLPYAISTFKIGALDVRASLNVEGEGFLPTNFLTTIAVSIASFYSIYTVLFFLVLDKKVNFIVKLSLCVGSLLYFLSSLCFAARDGVIFTLFSYVFFYFLFRKSISHRNKRKIKSIFIILIAILLPFIFIFTMQRFTSSSSGDNNRIAQGTLSYIGEQPFVFGETIMKQKSFYGGNLRFPLFQKVFGDYHEIVRTEIYEWSFGTFLTDFYNISGWRSLMIFIIIFYTFFNSALDKKKASKLYSYLIVLCFYFQFMTQGVFYFRMGMRGGNLYMIELTVLYLISKRIPVKRYINKKCRKKSPVFP